MNNEDKICISRDEAVFLYSLMPEWVKTPEPDLDITMYGTLSEKRDRRIHLKVKKLLSIK